MTTRWANDYRRPGGDERNTLLSRYAGSVQELDYLEGGHSLREFLDQFPTVRREMAVQALEEAKESLVDRIA